MRTRLGSVMVTTMLFLPVLLFFAIASVDVGYLNSEKAKMQTVADMAVVAALGNVDWDGPDVAAEETGLTASINDYLIQNGYAADLFGTPTFENDTENVVKIILAKKVAVRTFFWSWLTKAQGTKLDVFVNSAAEVEYDLGGILTAPEFGLYATGQAYLQGNSLTANAYDTSDLSETLYYDLVIGAGEQILFNADLDFYGDLYSSSVIDAGGATIYGDVLAADLESSDLPVIYEREFEVGDDGDDIEVNSTTTNPATEAPMPEVLLPQTTEADVIADPDYVSFADLILANPDALKILNGKITMNNNETLTLEAGKKYLFPLPFDSSQGSVVIAPADSGLITTFYSSYDFNASGDFSAAGEGLAFVSTNIDPLVDQEFQFTGGTELYMDIMAPYATVTVNGSATMRGRIYAEDITIQSDFIFDKNLPGIGLNWDVPATIKVKAHLVQ